MHTQHVKFSAYVASGVGEVVAVVFEEGEVSGTEEVDDDIDGSVLEVVVVVVFGLPSLPLMFVSLLVALMDCIDSI